MRQSVARVEILNPAGEWDSKPPRLRDDGTGQYDIEIDATFTLEPTPNKATVRVANLPAERLDQLRGRVRRRIEWTPEQRAELRAAGDSGESMELIYDRFDMASIRASWGVRRAPTDKPGFVPEMQVGFIGATDEFGERAGDRLTPVTVFPCEDGGQMLGAGRGSKVFRAGASTTDIMVHLIESCGLTVDAEALDQALLSVLLARGYAASKLRQIDTYNTTMHPAAELIKRVMDGLDLQWTIYNSRFILLDADMVLDMPRLDLSLTEGSLFSVPKKVKEGWSVQTWANPMAIPGREVSLKTELTRETLRIERADHRVRTKAESMTTLTLKRLETVAGVF